MHKILSAVFLLLALNARSQKQSYLLVGTYTGDKSEGIYVYSFNYQTGDAKYVSHIKSSNPSYLAVSPDNKFVYAVNEDKPGKITAYSFNKNSGTPTELNTQPSHGDHPCYITTNSNGKFVIAGNYSSGTVSVYPVKKDNSLDTAIQVIQHSGSSVNKERQQSAHVHATVLSKDNRYLFVPDLGMDKVMMYNFNAVTGKLNPAKQAFAETMAGSGPRHIDFHPNGKYAYLMKELNGEVEVFSFNAGKLKSVQTISSHPLYDKSIKASADIHVSPDGKFLYCSNRGASNTIAIFKINPADGKITSTGFQSTLGIAPRNFNFSPGADFLLVANQDSDNIVIFKRNKQTGELTDTGKRIEVGNPVCIKWIN